VLGQRLTGGSEARRPVRFQQSALRSLIVIDVQTDLEPDPNEVAAAYPHQCVQILNAWARRYGVGPTRQNQGPPHLIEERISPRLDQPKYEECWSA